MTEYIGNVAIPEIVASGVFPIVPDYGYGRSHQPKVAIHRLGSANAKIEQRCLLGTGAKRFTVRRSQMRESDRVALQNFWESSYGPYGAFTYNAPNDDGNGTAAFVCRFANEPLSWEFLSDAVSSDGVTLIEIPVTSPEYTLNQTVTRFPSSTLNAALLSQVQEIIPLIKIQPRESGYPAVYVSDRRCTVGAQLYQARLLEFDGISQSLGNESDEARFSFGNADRVMRELANDVDLMRASIEFSLFHVGTGIKLDLWKGEINDWKMDSGPEFLVTAADGIYELTLPYPSRRIARTCWKQFNDGLGCPFAGQSSGMDYGNFPDADPTRCDKSYNAGNGCLAHGMKHYFGGIMAIPQGVRVRDNSQGTWGYGRPKITTVSIVNDSIYDQLLPEIYTDNESYVDSEGTTKYGRLINCKIGAGRDESDFYQALGIVGEGPLTFSLGHTLDGQYHHGYPGSGGLRCCPGTDPAGGGDYFSLDTLGVPQNDYFAAGTTFLTIRRSDDPGLQLSYSSGHAMQAIILYGLQGWIWTASGVRSLQVLSNPIWIAVNMMLRARGLRYADAATAEQYFDVDAAIAAAAVCDESVEVLIGQSGYYETQFKFQGVLQEEKPLRDWIQEVLMNCLGYYTFAFGKLKLGVRDNSSAVEAFTEGNILFRSLQLSPLKPSFNHITANFGDAEFNFSANSVQLYDIDHAKLIGGAAAPLFLKSQMNLSGVSAKSQAARIITTRLREELGGITPAQWKAARQVMFQTTVLALNTEPGMVCSLTHPDMPDGVLNGDPEPNYGEFRVTGWKLNKDYSIDIQGQTTVDEMYDMVVGPKPADVTAAPVPVEAPHQSISAPKVPDQIEVSAQEAAGSRVIFKARALKYNEGVNEAELRAYLIQDNSNPESVDMRLISEGGTFIPDGITRLSVTGIAATANGAQRQHFFGAYVGRWYYAWRLKNAAGWSVWADGNESPKTVKYYIQNMSSTLNDSGPPSGGAVTLVAGAQAGNVQALTTRPATNGKRIWTIWFQVKDATKGAWRELDANAGAAVTRYDGSAISHTYDPAAGTLTKESGNYGDAGAYGGLMMVDVRGAQFDRGYCRFIALTPDQFSGATISGVTNLHPAFAPTGGVYPDLRVKIVKLPWEWADEENDGYLGAVGFQIKDFSGGSTGGDINSISFSSDPFTPPAGVAVTDLQARIWIETDYSFGDGSVQSGNYASGAAAQVILVAAAASTTVDAGLGRFFMIILNQDITLHIANATDGIPFLIIFVQDATGGRTVTLPDTEFAEGKDSAFAIAAEANARSYVVFSGNAAAELTDVLAPVRGY